MLGVLPSHIICSLPFHSVSSLKFSRTSTTNLSAFLTYCPWYLLCELVKRTNIYKSCVVLSSSGIKLNESNMSIKDAIMRACSFDMICQGYHIGKLGDQRMRIQCRPLKIGLIWRCFERYLVYVYNRFVFLNIAKQDKFNELL